MNEDKLIKKWLAVFREDVDEKIVEEHVTSYGNHLWHLFTWGNIACLEKDNARKTFDNLQYTEAIKFCGGYSNQINDISIVEKITAKELDDDLESDVYIVAKDFSWTYVRTHEREDCGSYFCEKKLKKHN